jgi:hypothetical protein
VLRWCSFTSKREWRKKGDPLFPEHKPLSFLMVPHAAARARRRRFALIGCALASRRLNIWSSALGIGPAGPGIGGPTIMNDTQLLSEVAQALYGAQWQASLSAAISVSDRSMRRWASGTDAIPWGVWWDIYRHLEARALTLDHWKKELYDRVVIRECEPRPADRFDRERDWRIEVHEPLDGRHSMKYSAIVQSLAEVRALMKKHPGMIFSVTMPFEATDDERHEFSQMNIQKL